MATLQGIPAPTDSYDHDNCTKANLASIRAMVAAFDASLDSLNDTISIQMKRLDDISKRASKCEEQLNADAGESKEKIGLKDIDGASGVDSEDPNSIVKINFPSIYENIINDAKSLVSALAKAKEEANLATRSVLREEAMEFETNAKPSDIWLDRASAFDEKLACQTALHMNSVPPLVAGADNSVKVGPYAKMTVMEEEAAYYRDGSLQEKITETQSQLESKKNRNKTTDAQEDDVSIMGQSHFSAQTGRGTLYTNYSEGTASHRRRQRKISAARRRKNSNGVVDNTDRSGSIQRHGNIDAGSSSRQHLMTGSLPYVCEMIHDTHRLGKLQDSHIFPQVEDLCDLFIYGSNEIAYDLGSKTSSQSICGLDEKDTDLLRRNSSTDLAQLAEDKPLSLENLEL